MTRVGTLTPPQNAPTRHPLEPWTPGAGDRWDRRKVAHLMRRAGFGPTPEQLDELVQLEMDDVVEGLLSTDRAPLPESGVVTTTEGEQLDLSVHSRRVAQWLHECVYTAHPLREKLALFWHDHFSVGSGSGYASRLMIRHVNLFRRFGLGDFRTLLVEVTRDPAMLLWLDNNRNGWQGKVNENYARELMELYTLGVNGGYTQRDVVELARCLSGWSLDRPTESFLYRAPNHLGGPKQLLGRTIHRPSDGEQEGFDAIDVLLERPEAARFVVEKIWRYFVSPEPEEAVLEALAERWRRAHYDTTELLRVLFKSRAFYAASAMRSLVKNPVELVIGLLRITGTTVERYPYAKDMIEQMGYPLMQYPSPAGLEDGMSWISGQALVARANFANEVTRVQAGRLEATFDPRLETTRLGLTTPHEVVERYLDLMVDGQAASAVAGSLRIFLWHEDAGRWPFRVNTTRADKKVRALVRLIACLPEFQLN